MNANMLLDLFGLTQSYTMPSQRTGTVSGDFASKLSAARQYTHTYIEAPPVTLKMGKNVLCSGEHYGQSYTVEYTPDSTDEDPIVRISGTANSGEFDFTCHIRDIDPSNASYVEVLIQVQQLLRADVHVGAELWVNAALRGGGDEVLQILDKILFPRDIAALHSRGKRA